MNRSVLIKWASLLLRLTFGAILIYASLDKIANPIQFAQAVNNYQIAGERLSRWIAIWLPYLELVIGIFLITGFWLDTAGFITLAMMVVFLIAVSQAYARGLDINCGCFSSEGGTRVNPGKIFENVLLLIGSILLFILILKDKKQN